VQSTALTQTVGETMPSTQSTTQPPAPQAIEPAVKRMAVFAAAAGLSTWAIDMAATQVGLPSMQSALGVSVTASQWILNISLMLLAGFVTVGGALGDRLGRLRVFRIGLLLLITGAGVTFVGGLMNQFGILLAGRALEGIGAACAIPASTAILLDVFPQAERGAAQGRMMVVSMAVTTFAPTLIGLVIQAISWPFAYLATVGAAFITLLLAARVKYTQHKPQATRFDYLGGVLVFLTVALLITSIMQGAVDGFTAPTVLLLFGAGLAAGVLLVILSLRKQHPLIQFRLFKIHNVSIGLFVTMMRYLPNALMGAFVARFAQQVLGLSPTVTGLMMILPVLAQVVAAPIAGRMLDKGGPRLPVALGVALLLGGTVLLAFGFPAQNIWVVLVGTIVGGAGFAFTNPVQMAALNQTPLAQRGMVAGIFPLAGQFGTALWVALLTAGLSAFMTQNAAAGEAAAQAQALGTLAWISAGVTLVVLLVTLLLRNTPPAAPAATPAPTKPATAKPAPAKPAPK
jgi:MFS family permease